MKRRPTLWRAVPLLLAIATGVAGIAALWMTVSLFRDGPSPPPPPHRTPDAPIDPAVPIAAYVPRRHFPHTTSFRLANGLQVLVLEDHRLPRMEATLTLDAGRIFDPVPGAAEMTAALLSEGTQTRNEEQFTDAVEQLGASFDSHTTIATAVLDISGLSEHTQTLLSLMAEAALHPAFREESLSRRIQSWKAYDLRNQGAGAVTEKVAASAFYGVTPYGRPWATAQEIAALGRNDIVAFYQSYYRPNSAVLAISGDVDVATVRRSIEQLFGGWAPAREPIALPQTTAFPSPEAGGRTVHVIDWRYDTESVITFQCLAVAEGDPDEYPLIVANQILGGQSGRLSDDLRAERGYTYSASSNFSAPSHWPGIWKAATTVPVADTDSALQDIESEMERLQNEPMRAAELDRAKKEIIGSFQLGLQNPGTVLGWAVGATRGGFPPDYYADYSQKIDAVTAADIQRVARKYFAPGRVQIFVVGPRQRMDYFLKDHGTVVHYDDKGERVL